MKHQGRSRIRHPGIILLILILLFCIPLGIAWLLYKTNDGTGAKLTNRGQLVTPPFSISLLKLRNSKGVLLDNKLTNRKIKPSREKRSNGQWLILYLYPGSCDKRCQKGLYNMRQIRLATGKNMDRIERAILTYQNGTPLPKIMQTEFAGTRHFSINKQQFTKVIQQHVKAPYALQPGTIYLVDPLGNVMMTYKPGAESSAIFKDLKRLLKVSQIG